MSSMDIQSFDEPGIRSKENKLFFKRFLRHPFQLGTIAPISSKFAKLAASQIKKTEEDIIVEIGSGTGRLTRNLLNQGVNPKNLIAVELDPEFCKFLRLTLPQEVRVIEGNAIDLPQLIPKQHVGKVSTVVSIIPLMYLSLSDRKTIINACLKILKPNGTIFHVTYSPKSPLADSNLPVNEQRISKLWLNLPPAFIWKYQPITIRG